MKKKRIVCGVVASALALSVTLGGCSSLTSANNVADMKQTIATVNISKAADLSEADKALFDSYKDAVGTTSITKRELISYFLNVGYSYINYGYSYEATFNQLVSNLVDTAVITQYSVMYLLNEKAQNEGMSAEAVIAAYNANETLSDKYEYVLGKDIEKGEDSLEVKLAKYSLMVALNSAIDSYEERILEDDDSSNSGSDTRSVPGGVNTEQEKFYPRKKNSNGKYVDDKNVELEDKDKDKAAIDYNVYTGYAEYELKNSGAYKDDALEGTTATTRKRAYNNFLSSVNSYNLIDVKNEDMTKVLELQYIQDEYVNQLEQQIINKYYEVYEEKEEEKLKSEGYIEKIYNLTFKNQQDTYKAEGFTSTLDSMSDTSFVLYAPKAEGHGVYEPDNESKTGKFGFVYNILLPFNALQSAKLSEYQSLYSDSDEDAGYTQDYFYYRNLLLKGIETTDQRAAWFNGSTEYAFNIAEWNAKQKEANPAFEEFKYYKNETNSDWLFFENNLVNKDRYEALKKYAGLYPYNGKVIKKDDGYVLIPNRLTIDDMLKEFSDYIDYVLDGKVSENNANVSFKELNYGQDENEADLKNTYSFEDKNEAYYKVKNFYKGDNATDETFIDYGKLLYAFGSVDRASAGDNIKTIHAKLYDKSSDQYKILSAVNELQYAYTTDTGVLSNYVGYSVDAANTNYIKEFEYAAQKAINEVGAGGFAVCAGDYGWHLIYVTYTVDVMSDDDRAQFEPDWSKIDEEGTFENLFYEWIKNQDIANTSTAREKEILTQFNISKTVKKYKKAYQDLLNLG